MVLSVKSDMTSGKGHAGVRIGRKADKSLQGTWECHRAIAFVLT